MILTRKLVDLLSDKSVLRHDRSNLPLFMKNDGLLRVSSPPGPGPKVQGNVLIDRTLTSPIQVVNWESEPVDPKYITATVQRAIETRKKNGLPVGNERSAFRLVNGVSDGLPGINIDMYGIYAVIHLYSAHWHFMVMDIAKSLFSTERRVEGVYMINRARKTTGKDEVPAYSDDSKAKSQCVWGRKAPEHRTIAEENGLLYHIQLDNGPALGLYMDQRENRTKVVDLLRKARAAKEDANSTGVSEPPTLLNTFSFTGSFSLAAAKYAGAKTTNVDASELVQVWARDNFVLNGMSPDDHEFVRRDTFSALANMFAQGRQFDVIVLDPPTISRVKVRTPSNTAHGSMSYTPSISAGSKTHFSALENYSDLVALAAPLVAPNGFLVCFVNTHSLDKDRWRHSIAQGLSSVIPKMREHVTLERQNHVRSYLRKRGVKTKFRASIIAKHTESAPSEDLIRNHYTFDLKDQWHQDFTDFTTIPGDDMGSYLHGLVLQRRAPTQTLEPVTLPSIRMEHLHASKRGDAVHRSHLTDKLRGAPAPNRSASGARAVKSPVEIKEASTVKVKGPWSSKKGTESL